jgi:hypothetical protein
MRLLLDSGSDFALSPDAAKRAGLLVPYPQGYDAYGPSGKKIPVGVVTVHSLTIGTATLPPHTAIVVAPPHGCDGAIGYPIFAPYR